MEIAPVTVCPSDQTIFIFNIIFFGLGYPPATLINLVEVAMDLESNRFDPLFERKVTSGSMKVRLFASSLLTCVLYTIIAAAYALSNNDCRSITCLRCGWCRKLTTFVFWFPVFWSTKSSADYILAMKYVFRFTAIVF